MTESTTELFNNFKGILNNYTSNAFYIGMCMAYRKKEKEDIKKFINYELELYNDLEEYAKALTTTPDFYLAIIDDIEKLRSMSYSIGKLYCNVNYGEFTTYENKFIEEKEKMINFMEKELENA